MEKRDLSLIVLFTLFSLTLIALYVALTDANITGQVVASYEQAKIEIASRYIPKEFTLKSGKAQQFGQINLKIVDHGDWIQLVTITDIKNINKETKLIGISGKIFSVERTSNSTFSLSKVNLGELVGETKVVKENDKFLKETPVAKKKAIKKEEGYRTILERIFGF